MKCSMGNHSVVKADKEAKQNRNGVFTSHLDLIAVDNIMTNLL